MAKEIYGLKWPESWSDLEVELYSFVRGTAGDGGEPDNKEQHFKNIVKMYWGPKSKKHFVWNPWNERMLEACCSHKFVSLSGCAASGKTDFAAVWGIVNWLAMPTKTVVLFTSVSLAKSRQGIWGRVEEYFDAANQVAKAFKLPKLPGKSISSMAKIRTEQGTQKFSERCGMYLIPGEASKEKENIGKIIGLHNDRVVFICDEMPELSPALTEAAETNLKINPYFQMMRIGNFKSIYDPFGTGSTPKMGWGSVSEDSEEWETVDGVCLRFDGLKSPNIVAGRNIYKGIYCTDDLVNHKLSPGEHTAGFWRMCRSFPCPEADSNRIYSEADFIKGRVHEMVKWIEPPVKVAALDPAFATGGDKAISRFGLIGTTAGDESRRVLLLTERIEIREDLRKKDENRSVQVAKQYRDMCIARGVEPENAAYDGSGGGMAFGGLLAELWSPKLLGVQFGGAASMRPASSKDPRPGKDAYSNRVAELWFAGVDFMHSGQIKGMDIYAAKDLKERRTLDSIKGATGLRQRVESKKEMKLRIGHSPDDGDCFAILLDLCRDRHKFMPIGMTGQRAVSQNSWKQKAMLVNRIWANSSHANEAEEIAA